ncbi:MAG TPA: arylamine N-acetyltransferase [Anaerolineales bacterium]|nr:arylamine N-acetyltransferase [Anaerolineales bacterium]
MKLITYLERINYKKSTNPDVETLYGLHRAHMLAVPFENLDIGLGRTIKIDEQAIWDKIIVNKRGGFCYELNGLFAWLLKQIGFNVTYLNARVYNRTGELGSDFDHLTLLVQIPDQSERWLADVGFGDSFIEPLRFDEQDEHIQGVALSSSKGPRAYRLQQTSDGYIVWQKNYTREWEQQYYFDLQPHRFPDEYLAGCQYHQTSPKSSFTRGSIISKALPDGRISLEEENLIITINGVRTEKPVLNQAEHQLLLKEHFDVSL